MTVRVNCGSVDIENTFIQGFFLMVIDQELCSMCFNDKRCKQK